MPIIAGFPGRYTVEIASRSPIASVATATAAFVGRTRHGPINEPFQINSLGAFADHFGGLCLDSPLSFAVQDFFLNGGDRAIVVRIPEPQPGAQGAAADFMSADAAEAKTGLYALDRAKGFNLLCIPPHTLEGTIEPALIEAAIAYCTSRRAMMIIDPPAGWRSADDVIAAIDHQIGPASADAAVYFPRIIQKNPLRANREEAFAACGAIAGVIARTDAQQGVWKAPAGLAATLTTAESLAVRLSDVDLGRLNARGVNCLRELAGRGRFIWGARTRRGADDLADEWKYIPVRRTAMLIAQSLRLGLEGAVFEPNDEHLWADIREQADNFMHRLFRQGAFRGQAQHDAWFVRCGRDTTTADELASGIINISVGFAPLKPAEFVVLRITLHTAHLADP